jgi:hypothetical protein
VAIPVYGSFAGWITVQRTIDWNMRRPFLRAYSQIRPGMTKEELDAIIRREFPDKLPVAEFSGDGRRYRLGPDDGRFNSEFIVFLMTDGKVTSFYYLPD